MVQRILITGASKGIGQAIAERIASPERELLLHGRDKAALAVTKRRAESKGAKTNTLCYDFSSPEQVEELIREVGSEPLHCLINNAGLGHTNPLSRLSLEQWQTMFAVNVTAPFLLIQGLSPHMRPGGLIINILSVSAKTAYPTWGAYTMTKFALDGFSKVVREELRPSGIRVVNLYPGASNTEIWNDVEGPFHREKMMSAKNTADAVAFVLERPEGVLVEDITMSNLGSISD